MRDAALAARLLLAGVFLVAALSKARDGAGIRVAMAQLGVSERVAPFAGMALCLVEFGVAVTVLVPATARPASLAAAGLLIAFCAVIVRSMLQGQTVECHCFGQLHSEPLGGRSLVRNAVLLVAALAVAGSGGPQLDPVGWFGGLAAVDQVLVAVLAGLTVVVLVQAAVLFELFARHGEILSRLRDLEGPSSTVAPAPAGLQPGVPAPPFSLPDMDGETVSLPGLLAGRRPALLVFSDPRCGPCNAMLDDVADWAQRLGHAFTTVMISRGQRADIEAKLGDRPLDRVLVDESGVAAVRYQVLGTPSAVLVGGDGRIARPIAMGPAAIAELVAEAAQGADGPRLVVADHVVASLAQVGVAP